MQGWVDLGHITKILYPQKNGHLSEKWIPDDSRTYDSHNCANHLSNYANDLTLKLVSNCPLKPNLNTIYKIWLQVRATPNLVSNQIVWLNVHFSHNMHKGGLSTAYAISFKIVLGEFQPSLTDSDRHKQLRPKLSIDYIQRKYVAGCAN